MVEVLFRDAHLLAVNKPAGVPAQPDLTGDADVCALLGLRDAGIPHRLDRPVSGALLIALDNDVLNGLNAAFADRRVEKTYLAIVEGRVEQGADLAHHLVHDTRLRKARVVDGPRKGATLCRLRVDPVRVGDRYTLVKVVPEGGRFHQIRAQLSAAGHPIKGDVKYGARRGEPDRSIALHAHRLRFEHPLTGAPLEVVAPPPGTGIWPRLLAEA